jgi:hypothetical protein
MHSHESHTPSEGHTPSSSRLCVVQVRARLFLSVSMAVENVRDQTFVVSACKKKLNNNITELTPHTRFSLCLSVKKARSIFSMHRPISTRAMEENSAHKILTPVRIAHRSAPETHPALPTWVRVGWLGCVFLIDLVRKACVLSSLTAQDSHHRLSAMMAISASESSSSLLRMLSEPLSTRSVEDEEARPSPPSPMARGGTCRKPSLL